MEGRGSVSSKSLILGVEAYFNTDWELQTAWTDSTIEHAEYEEVNPGSVSRSVCIAILLCAKKSSMNYI